MSSALTHLENALAAAPETTSCSGLSDVAALWRKLAEGESETPETISVFRTEACDRGEGAWLMRLKENDFLASGALSAIAPLLAGTHADAVVLDDIVLKSGVAQLRAKPVYDPVLLTFSDYIGRSVLFRRDALPTETLDRVIRGANPKDILKTFPQDRIGHCPLPSLAIIDAPLEHAAEVSTARKAPPPPTSIIIPNKNSPLLIKRCLQGVLDRTNAPEIEVIIVDNGSDDPATLAEYDQRSSDDRLTVIRDPAPFNFAAMVNTGAAHARHEHILLLNNDIEVLDGHWLAEMADVLSLPDVGVVGAKLLFPDRTIQHGGVIIGHGGVAGHDLKAAPESANDALHRMTTPHSRSAVTAAAMLTTKTVWRTLDGFDQSAFPIAFNDVDFCLRARAQGFGVAMATDAVLIHHEGKSRKKGWSLSRYLQHQRERAMLRARHGTRRIIDPFENPWRDHETLTPSYRTPKIPLQLRY